MKNVPLPAVIVANGEFPTHPLPLLLLEKAAFVLCCDGAVKKVMDFGITPDLIIGDMDSIPHTLPKTLQKKLVQVADQDTNDLTKAVNWCGTHGIKDIHIIGATGLREDHCLGNIFLLPGYSHFITPRMWTNHGLFSVSHKHTRLKSFKGQQVSVFNPLAGAVSSLGLRYPLNNTSLSELWQGTLNESLGLWFDIYSKNPVLIFRQYEA